jgi:hypothetical protein
MSWLSLLRQLLDWPRIAPRRRNFWCQARRRGCAFVCRRSHRGVLTGTLLPETKLDATRAADIVITYRYLSGLSFGIWMEQLVASEVSPAFYDTSADLKERSLPRDLCLAALGATASLRRTHASCFLHGLSWSGHSLSTNNGLCVPM